MLPRCSGALSSLKYITHRNHFHGSAAAVAQAPTPTKQPVNLDKLFWSKPCSLAVPLDSPHRIEEPHYQGIKRFILKLMLFYSKQSKSIRGANVIYRRVVMQVNLLLSKWMKELVKIFYGNIVSYDAAMLPGAKQDELQNAVTVRVRSPWVRNIFSDDGTSKLDDATLRAVQAMTRYVRREVSCLSLTGKEAIMFSGNFMFTPLETTASGPLRK